MKFVSNRVPATIPLINLSSMQVSPGGEAERKWSAGRLNLVSGRGRAALAAKQAGRRPAPKAGSPVSKAASTTAQKPSAGAQSGLLASRTGRQRKLKGQPFARFKLALRGRRDNLYMTVCAVVVLTLIFGLLLLNQSRIISLTFANASLVEKIEKVSVGNVQSHSALAAQTDLSKIREKAIALGMVEPNQRQIRQVVIPQEDEVKLFKEGRRP